MKIWPIAFMGGALWCIGNCTVVPIVNLIGLSLGLLLWGITNMSTGWLVGHFGIGTLIPPDPPVHTPVLSYVGFGVALASVLLYFPVKSHVTKQQPRPEETDTISSPATALLAPKSFSAEYDPNINSTSQPASEEAPLKHKVIGVIAALVAGVLYGSNMLPVTYLQHQNPTASPIEFAFSHFLGVWATSSLIVCIYSAVKKNRPFINEKTLLPGFAAGIGWAIAMCGWFYANANLGLTTAFPIICTGPGIVGTVWGIACFKEIQGLRNFLWLGGAFLATLVGIILITVSHV